MACGLHIIIIGPYQDTMEGYLRILIIGSDEIMGDIFKTLFSDQHSITCYKKSEYNMLKWDSVINNIAKLSPAVTIHSQFVEDPYMELNPKVTLDRTVQDGTRNLAQGCARYDSKLVHVSSEAVFDGKKPFPQPYFEEDRTRPISEHGKVKLEGEIGVYENMSDYIIFRTGWLYHPIGDNFIKVFIRKAISSPDKVIRVPANRYGSPTLSYRVAMQIKKLLEADSRGIHHITSEGYCSLAECAEFVLKHLKLDVKVEPYEETEESPQEVIPGNWILENKSLKSESLNIMVPWEQDLTSFLDRYGQRLLEEEKNRLSNLNPAKST